MESPSLSTLAVKNKKETTVSLDVINVYKDLESDLLEQLRVAFERENTISDELLESLYFIYKGPLLEALNQMDKHELDKQKATDHNATTESSSLVSLLKSEKHPNRFVYQVKGSMGINYYLFERLSFCSCSSFKYDVLGKNEYFYCKHMIMIKLLKAMNKLHVKIVKDTELIDFIKQIH
jgi:predicted nucleic acid-binding Zn finger protein